MDPKLLDIHPNNPRAAHKMKHMLNRFSEHSEARNDSLIKLCDCIEIVSLWFSCKNLFDISQTQVILHIIFQINNCIVTMLKASEMIQMNCVHAKTVSIPFLNAYFDWFNYRFEWLTCNFRLYCANCKSETKEVKRNALTHKQSICLPLTFLRWNITHFHVCTLHCDFLQLIEF